MRIPKLRFKPEYSGTYPDWKEKKLGDIGKIVTGKTPSTFRKDLWDGDIPFVTPTDIVDTNIIQKVTARSVKEDGNELPKNTIMYVCIASIGKMSISSEDVERTNKLIP